MEFGCVFCHPSRSSQLRQVLVQAGVKTNNLLIASLLLLCPAVWAQPLWSGIINSSRAINWSNAGVVGGIPNRNNVCQTIAAYSGSATAINNAIGTCGAGNVLMLGAGTFNLSSGITFGSTNNVTLRGQGANSTFIVFTGSTSCAGINPNICMGGSSNSVGAEQNVCDWTSGYSAGTTSITLSNCGSTTPAKGAIGNLKVGGILILDQVDETADTGTIWNCLANNVCSNAGSGGDARTDGPSVGGTSARSQQQVVIVASCDSNSTIGHACSSSANIGISPGLYMPNWRSGQAPQAWFPTTTITGDGVEDLSIDNTSSGSHGFTIFNAANCWVKGVRSMLAGRSHVQLFYTTNNTVENSYFFQSQSHGTVSYTIEEDTADNNLVQNNICQQVTDSCPANDGGAEGNVHAYNFSINQIYNGSGWFQAAMYQHTSGDDFNLWEGNIADGYTSDDVHGTHHFETLYRNYFRGNQNAGCGTSGGTTPSTCTAQTVPIQPYAASRYYNIIGNVLGQSGYHNNYQCVGASSQCSKGNTSIYTMGFTGNGGAVNSSLAGFCLQPACSSNGDYDPQTAAYMLRWGNYDTVTGTVRWCGNSSDTGWSTTCGSTSEVPTGLASYSNAVPTLGDTGGVMPASFYLATQPSWWGSLPWPAIGPEVGSGNLGVCSGGTYANAYALTSAQCTGGSLVTGLGGHVNANPALNCYFTVMGGTPDGTTGGTSSAYALAFNESTCYGTDGDPTLAPQTSLTAAAR